MTNYLAFSTRSDIVVIGHNPEMADYDNRTGAIHGLAWYVEAINSRGDVWECRVTSKGDAKAAAEALAARLEARMEHLGKQPVGFATWAQGRPVYGSQAYVEYGQADDLAWERQCDADEALGLR